jgi:YegS/Rv2252/BmrU family lipid kinase
VVARLNDIGISTEIQTSHSNGAKRPPLDLEGKQLVVVRGGDGTIHEVIPDVVKAGLPMAILPAGTANVLARELGLPRELDDAIDVLRRGRVKALHLGQANGQYFHLMAGIGADGYIISKVGSSLKGFLGVVAYWLTGLTRFWNYPLIPFEVEFEDGRETGTSAVISNARSYGGQLLLAPRASVFERNLDVCLFTATNHLRFVKYLWGSFQGKHLDYPDVIYRKAKSLLVTGSEQTPVQLDGELKGYLPRHFRSAEERLRVFVP